MGSLPAPRPLSPRPQARHPIDLPPVYVALKSMRGSGRNLDASDVVSKRPVALLTEPATVANPSSSTLLMNRICRGEIIGSLHSNMRRAPPKRSQTNRGNLFVSLRKMRSNRSPTKRCLLGEQSPCGCGRIGL